MRLISLILPFVRRVARNNLHDQEAKDLIRQIEGSNVQVSPVAAAMVDESQRVVEQLQEEINELKKMHAREIMCMQQESAV
jgi:hypothetical protein